VKPKGTVGVSFIGAGNFARGVLLKNLCKQAGIEYRGILTATGQSAVSAGNKYGFEFCTSEMSEILDDPGTDAVFIATRHSQHADLVCQALKAGKTVFVEKPLALNVEQLGRVREAVLQLPNPQRSRLMVGYNRRFAPMSVRLKQHFADVHPLSVHYRVNAGMIPAEHWLSDPMEGGRIIGEACHFLDFFAFLTDSTPVSVDRLTVDRSSLDDAQMLVTYADGSVCHLTYTTAGAKATSKERIEVFGGGRSGLLDDFRSLQLDTGSKRILNQRSWFSQDKGHAAEIARFIQAVRLGQSMPISVESLIKTTELSFAATKQDCASFD
jgi:predicted dehydrogenase